MMINDFLKVLSTCVEVHILTDMHKNSALSILCDESTDIGNIEQVLFGKYIIQGSPKTRFLKVVGKAGSIEQILVQISQSCNIAHKMSLVLLT